MKKDPKIKKIDKEIASFDREIARLKEILDTQQLEKFDRKIIEILKNQVKIKNSNKELDNNIDNFINQVKIEKSNKELDNNIDNFLNQIRNTKSEEEIHSIINDNIDLLKKESTINELNKYSINELNKKKEDYLDSISREKAYAEYLKKANKNNTPNPYIDSIKEKRIEQHTQSYEDYLKKNKEKIDKLDNQNTQVVKKYVEVVKEDVPKETIEEQIQFNREKEKVANLMVESFKINYMAEKGLKEITNHNDFLNFMEDKFITKISNLDDEDLKYKVHNDFESLRDKYIKDNNVNRQHNQSSKSKEFLDEKKKYLLAQASQEISFNELFF